VDLLISQFGFLKRFDWDFCGGHFQGDDLKWVLSGCWQSRHGAIFFIKNEITTKLRSSEIKKILPRVALLHG